MKKRNLLCILLTCISFSIQGSANNNRNNLRQTKNNEHDKNLKQLISLEKKSQNNAGAEWPLKPNDTSLNKKELERYAFWQQVRQNAYIIKQLENKIVDICNKKDASFIKKLLQSIAQTKQSKNMLTAISLHAEKRGLLTKENSDLAELRCKALTEYYIHKRQSPLKDMHQNKDLEFAQYAINNDYKDVKGSILVTCAYHGYTDIAKLLIKNAADANYYDPRERETPLTAACINNRADIALNLINHGAKIEGNSPYGVTPLMCAARTGSTDAAAVLIKSGANIHARDWEGNTPLIEACWGTLLNPPVEPQIEIVKLLLDNGAKIDDASDGHTALITACKYNKINTAKMLIQYGADVNAKTKYGDTALIFCTYDNHIDLVKLLIDAKANVNEENKEGKTPLIQASVRGRLEIIRLLLANNANVNQQDKSGNTALMESEPWGTPELINELVNHGAQIDLTNNKGNTALIIMCQHGNIELAKTLIKHNANMTIKNNAGKTAIDALKQYMFSRGKQADPRYQEIIELLEKTANMAEH